MSKLPGGSTDTQLWQHGEFLHLSVATMKRNEHQLSIEIVVENPNRPEIFAFLQAGSAYMEQLYPAESNYMLDVSDLSRPEVTFIAARVDGRAVGCGAIVISSRNLAEIKRMFVSPAVRGRHIGRQLLQRLEAIAADSGALLLRLETGIRQPEALALYRSAGFVEVGPFGEYRADPLSIFMQKPLPLKIG